ncbi:hypothetical protein LOTGIDRAFT_209091 [Lottia gigantea]|uniref:Phosphatidylinositol transfer protein N-terminal domain-containing protein n=1 Tax=Lottia gigantea TaxID=225164 RepID=V4C866_LOTGI|nr:hypothetical protein LOTGIDRAFT_209091 [Lottia gigantea]ESO97894.1 hypothetical protein LOTGIDRAFT_209091 [Lottia gigantea]
MLLYEFRVVLPMEVEEYQRAQLYSVAEASKNETGGGEGIEVMQNEPFDMTGLKEGDEAYQDLSAAGKTFKTGQFTNKTYHLASKVPRFIRILAPKGALEINEKAWNAYPYCRTLISNPEYMKENFYIVIESMHIADNGHSENVHNLSEKDLAIRQVVNIDIAADVSRSDYKEEWDPKLYKSSLTGRGPLNAPNWKDTVKPVMCAYKLVRVHFKWWGLQNKVEKLIQKQEERLFTNFHRQVFCWTDKWYPLTMNDIRELEEKTKEELDQARVHGEVKGMVVKD